MRTPLLAALAAPALLGLSLVGGAPQDAATPSFAEELFPPARQGMYLDEPVQGADGPRLLDLLHDYERVTGLELSVSNETLNLLRQYTAGNLSEIEIPPHRVHQTVQAILMAADFCLVPLTDEAPRLVAVRSLMQASSRNTIKQRALYVDAEELESLRDYSAVLVTTRLDLPYTDVRQLATSLRPLMPDQSTSSMLNAGSSDSLILTGFAPQIGAYCEMLRDLDAQAEARWKERAAVQAGDDDASDG